MRILRRNQPTKMATMALASTFAMAASACLHGQSLANAPLPSYYAGHTASIQIVEPTQSNAVAVPRSKPTQGSKHNTEGVLPVDRSVALGAHREAGSDGGSDVRGVEEWRVEEVGVEEVSVEEVSVEEVSVEEISVEEVSVKEISVEEVSVKEEREDARADAGRSDAERRATLLGDVYDGLPIEGRFEHRTAPRAHFAPQAERNTAVRTIADDVKNEISDGNEDGDDEDGDDEDGDDEDGDEDGDEDEDEDEDGDDELAEHFEAVEQVLNSKLVGNILGLMQENCKLKAQLKIQEIEFEARRQIEAAELRQREAQRRIQELENGNEGRRREQHAAEMRMEAQAGKAKQHSEMLQRELSKNTRELNELRAFIEQLQQQAKKSQAVHEKKLQETLRKLDETQKSKAELEHRARVLETQLEQSKGKQESPRRSDKKKRKR